MWLEAHSPKSGQPDWDVVCGPYFCSQGNTAGCGTAQQHSRQSCLAQSPAADGAEGLIEGRGPAPGHASHPWNLPQPLTHLSLVGGYAVSTDLWLLTQSLPAVQGGTVLTQM